MIVTVAFAACVVLVAGILATLSSVALFDALASTDRRDRVVNSGVALAALALVLISSGTLLAYLIPVVP